MKEAKAQFHTAHDAYNQWVRDLLDKIKLSNDAKKDTCPERQANLDYLRDRLNEESARLRVLVTGSRESWKYNVYTSNEAKDFM